MYINYEWIYKYRPEEKDLIEKDNVIGIRTMFPKTIKKGTYIHSSLDNGIVSFDAIKESIVLINILKKPIIVCPTTGRWEGTPFLLQATENIVITLEDEKVIQNNIDKVRFNI